jgi:FkbM family methyltransferase
MKIRWRYSSDQSIRTPWLLWRKAKTAFRLWLGIQPPDMELSFFGRDLVVRQGTIRLRSDEDDAWVLACQQHATSMFDIGCHIGFSALLGLLGGNIKEIVLVDASPDALTIAAKNLIQNQLSASARFVWGFAAENDRSTVSFFTGDAGAASSAYINSYTHSNRGKKIDVKTVSVDSLSKQYSIEPDFVKIDVEGAEDVVLNGACQLAAKRKTRFLVEVHHHASKPISENTKRIMEWCTQQNYKAWLLRMHIPLENVEQIADSVRFHVLLQPMDWEYPDWIAQISAHTQVEFA